MPNENDAIATRSREFNDQHCSVELPHDLMGGTPAMCKAATKYLPQGSVERKEDYQDRLMRTVLLNAYKRTVGYLTGQVFEKDPSLEEEKGAPFEEFVENVDLAGNNLAVFGQRLFLSALNDGVDYLLVDMPPLPVGEDGRPRQTTLKDDKDMGRRPYWVLIQAEQVIDGWYEVVNGKPVLQHFRYFEAVQEQAGRWGKKDVRQIRVLEPGRWEVWREVEGSDKKKAWVMQQEGINTLPMIPLVPLLLGEKTGPLTARPALEDLAHLNKRHWQCSSDHGQLMTWVRRPPWFGKCLQTEDGSTPAFGPNKLVTTNNPDGDLSSKGVDSSSVQASRDDLRDIEQQMALYGLSLLMPKTGNVTATEKALDSAESDSTLKRWALAMKDAIEQAFVFTALWIGMKPEDAPGVHVHTDYSIALGDLDADLLTKAFSAGLLSKETVIEEFRRRGLVRDDLDVAEELERITQESRSGTFLGAASRSLGTPPPQA